MKKQVVIDVLETLPNEFDLEELISKLILLEKIDKGLQDVSESKLIPIDEARHRFNNKH